MRFLTFASVMVVFCTATAATSQVDDERAILRAEQTALFEAMRADPQNLDLMFSYALLSIRLEDFEQAVATLERMLIFNRDLPRVKLELAVSYFRLGAYEAARFHLEEALEANPPPQVQERIAAFLAQIDERTQKHRFAGFASIGAIYSSNATLGPDDRDVTVSFNGVNTVTAQLDQDATAEDAVGARLSLGLTHVYDMGGAREDRWISRASYIGQRYDSVSEGGFDIVEASTGPSFALDDEPFGLRARPFVRGGYVASGQDSLYKNAGGGVEVSDAFGADYAGFARVGLDWREYSSDNDGFTGAYGSANVGATYLGVEDTRFTITALLETDRTDDDFLSNTEIGLRLSASRDLDIALTERDAGPWTASAFGQISGRFYDDANPSVDPDKTREDVDLRVGARLYAPVTRRIGVALDASYFERFSNIRNYDVDSFELGVSAIARF